MSERPNLIEAPNLLFSANRIHQANQIERVPAPPDTLTTDRTDLTVDRVALVWTPWILDAVGMAQPAFGE